MPNTTRRLLLAGAAAAIATSALAFSLGVVPLGSAIAAGGSSIGAWGFDLNAMDRSIKPGDDFFRYAGGTWMKNTQIPPDRTRWGSFNILGAKSEEDVKNVVEQVAHRSNAPGSIEQKVADYYTSYMDTKAIDAAGLKPFEGDLGRINALKTPEDIATLLGDPGFVANAPIGWGIAIDQKNPDRYSFNIGQGGLGMPDRDYYLKPDQKFAEARNAYRAYIEKMLTLANYPNAKAAADAVMAVEMKIAELQWPIEKQRDREANYNPKNRAELKAFVADFPWDQALAASGVSGQDFFVVGQPDAVVGLAKLFRATPVDTWKHYLTFHYLNANADIMPTAFDDASFDFNGRVLTGQQVKRDRWKRAATIMSGTPFSTPMSEAVGQLYVRDHFTPQAKAQVREIVENLLASYRARIQNLEWMSPETRKVAMLKAQNASIKIGYPDKWRDYSNMEIKPNDAYGNRLRSNIWDWKRQTVRLNRKTERGDWGMGPQTVNAYYNAQWNEIVFPAAILQPPFFDPNADPAINYGAIGGVIGHEMGHGYDDQGAKSDERGVLRTWWKKEDEDRFQVKVKALAAQYSAFEPLPGLHVNGNFTSGENIGDLGGLTVAHDAYMRSLNGKTPPVLDGFTGEQRFFFGWAQVWRSIIRDDMLRVIVTSDVHSPAEYRCNGVVRNVDAWYTAFDIKPGDKLYLPPEQRVHIW